MRSRKLAWFLMLGLLIALAGCGSDGNGGGATVMPDPPPVDMDALNAAKAAAMTAYEEAKQAVADVEAHKSADMDSYNMAVAKRGEAMDANTKAQEAETVADAEKYRDMARTANADAMKYAGMVTTAAEEAANKAASAAAMALAAKIAPAIADPDGDGMLGENNADTDAAAEDDLNNPMRPGKATENTDDFVVTAGGIGTEPVIRIGAADATGTDRLGMEDAAVANNIEFAGEEGTAVGSFARNVHTRSQTSGGVKTTDKVTVLDNIDEVKRLAYREFYDVDGDTNHADAETSLTRAAVTGITAAGVLSIDTTTANAIANNHELFSSARFPSAATQTFTYADDNPETPANEEMGGGRMLDGMFNGVPGKFACTDTSCTAVTDSDGNLNSLTGAWTFTPAAGTHFVENGIYDNDYLAFGYWLQTTGEGDDAAYKVGTFASGSMPFGGDSPAAAVAALKGSATYTGSATGMFVMKTDIDGDNKGPVETGSGEFTADTTLTAIFGGTSDTDNRDKFTISGMVHNFALMNSDDTTIDNDWSLNLQSAPFATRTYNSETGEVDAAPTTHVNTFRGSTSGMEKGTAGSWTGTFYGPSPDIDPDAGGNQYGARNYPGGVAGEFIGHFENGHAVGAFGATKK